MKTRNRRSLPLAFLLFFGVTVAAFGLIKVSQPYDNSEWLVNSSAVQKARGLANATTPVGKVFLARFDNGNGTYTYALFRKVYVAGSFQYGQVSQSVTQGTNEAAPDLEIDPDLNVDPLVGQTYPPYNWPTLGAWRFLFRQCFLTGWTAGFWCEVGF